MPDTDGQTCHEALDMGFLYYPLNDSECADMHDFHKQEGKPHSTSAPASLELRIRRMAVLLGDDVLNRSEPLVEAALLNVSASVCTAEGGMLNVKAQVRCMREPLEEQCQTHMYEGDCSGHSQELLDIAPYMWGCSL